MLASMRPCRFSEEFPGKAPGRGAGAIWAIRSTFRSAGADFAPRIAAACLCIVATAPTAHAAHPISITQVSAYVQREKLTVAIDLFLEDLFLFHNLQANDQNRLEPATIREGIDRHRAFLLERFQVLDEQTEPLSGKIVDVKVFDIPSDGIPLGDLMSYSLTYTIEYTYEEPPRFLTFVQRLVDPALGIPAEMTLRVKQAGVEGDRVWSLQVGKPEVVDLDWDSPPPSPEASQAEWDEWMAKKREATLGITSYSSVYSFLYIEDGEVRHEILVPLLTLEESVLIPRDDDATLDLTEQEAAREQISAFFAARNPVTIDGKPVAPEVARIDFYGLNFVDFAKRAEAKPVGLANARVGIILRYPTATPPNEVALQWDFFNDFVFAVQSMVYTDEDVQQVAFSQDDPESTLFRWKRSRPWQPPNIQPVAYSATVSAPTRPARAAWAVLILLGVCALAVACLGLFRREQSVFVTGALGLVVVVLVVATAGTEAFRVPEPAVGTEQQEAVFRRLHHNMYEAFRYRSEEPLYDALAISVDGPLLRKLYLQIRNSLVMAEQGGAVSRIRNVTILDLRPLASSGSRGEIRARCRWSVEGTVEHWGHIHGRTNTYEAILAAAPRDGQWRLVDVQLQQEEQTAIQTRLRGLPR